MLDATDGVIAHGSVRQPAPPSCDPVVAHLDTSSLVDLIRELTRGTDGPAHRMLQTLTDEELAISIHVSCELHAGAELSNAPPG